MRRRILIEREDFKVKLAYADLIVRYVCCKFGLTDLNDLKYPPEYRIFARHVAAHFIREKLNISHRSIARIIGYKSHKSVAHGLMNVRFTIESKELNWRKNKLNDLKHIFDGYSFQ